MITPIISLALGVSFSAFFGMGFWVFGQDSPSQFTSSDLVLTDGIGSLLLTIVLLLLPLLWLLTYRRLPFGSITLYFLVPFCLMCVLYPSLSMVAVGLLTGLAADGLYRGWNLYADRGLRRRCFFVLIPLLLAGGYYLVLEIWLGVVWNVEFWTGGIVLSGLTGLAISYFQPVEAERVE